MKGFAFFAITILYCLQNCTAQESLKCESKVTCSECIQTPDCVWCISPSNSTNCLNRQYASTRWCRSNLIIDHNSKYQIIKDEALRSQGERIIQIRPQKISVTARKGDKIKIPLQYSRAKNYPVDLYYLMDLSHSMEPHKNKLAELGVKLATSMRNLTSNFRLGFGSFIDKNELPFADPCEECGMYSFKNHMNLSSDDALFAREVKRAKLQGNIDPPEGGFDALMQAMVCEELLGWRPEARHLIVFSTDAEYHVAGDGKLLGILEPNDGNCHMVDNIYAESLTFDYPSVGHISYVAKTKNYNIIFAIANKPTILQHYKLLSQKVENSNFGVLSDDSENVIQLLVDNYNKIVDSVILTSNATDDISVTFDSSCRDKIADGCNNIGVEEVVDFSVTIEALRCNKDTNRKTIAIKPKGLQESILIDLNVICDCNCTLPQNSFYEKNSPKCSGFGNLECGICNCQFGRFGSSCECDTYSTNIENTTLCQSPGSDLICSGLGECKCGKCNCFNDNNGDGKKIYGQYCQCNNYSCKKNEGLLCSGRGECDCGNCKCDAGWSGDACQCPQSTSVCIAPWSNDNDQKVCSGRGSCECGRCKCSQDQNKNKYTGKYCEECSTCEGQRCTELKDCVECQVFKNSKYNKRQCLENCGYFDTKIVDKIEVNDKVKQCRIQDDTGCYIIFSYIYNEYGKLIVEAEKEKSCAEKVKVWAWVAGVVGTIVLAGLVALIVWKIFTTIHDRREYAKFEEERARLKWSRTDNPLYKDATTTFKNPAYKN